MRVAAENVIHEQRVENLLDHAAAVPDGDRIAGAGNAVVRRDRQSDDLETRDGLHAIRDFCIGRDSQEERLGARDPHGRFGFDQRLTAGGDSG
jgi:hypothetical protein